MQTLAGTLIYSGSWTQRPWLLKREGEDSIDLYPLIDQWFAQANGRPARQEHERAPNGYRLSLDASAELVLTYESDGAAMLVRPGGIEKALQEKRSGTTIENIGAYLPQALVALSGRQVIVTLDDTGLAIDADPAEQVYGVKFFGDGNDCRVPVGAERSVCKRGTPECCIFLAAGPEGFVCQKFNRPVAEELLKRYAAGTMRAKRVGSCTLIGREEDTRPRDPLTEPMSLATRQGQKVLFNRPYAGWDGGDHPRKYLQFDETYTVDRVVVGDSMSDVYLKEVPGISFNTVHFENVQEEAVA